MFPVLEIENRLIPKTTVAIRSVQVLLDVLVLAAAFAFAYMLRFEFSLQDPQIRTAAAQMVLVVVFQILILRLFGIHKFIWRYIGILEANHILKALAVASVPFLFIRFAIAGSLPFPVVPVSIVVIDFLLAAVGILGIRLIRREIYENMRFAVNSANGRGNERRSVLLIGAGRAGLITLAELKTGYNLNYQVEGFIDDDPLRQGLVISGVKVLGKTADIPRLVRELDVDHVIITIAQLSRTDMQRILGVCKEADVKVKTIPCLSDLLEEKVFVSRSRDVEVEDLLGRSPIQLDRQ
ncbi:MAG: hypothetical protein ABL984_04095, partial [Pyrinomonadaceae bacterium]